MRAAMLCIILLAAPASAAFGALAPGEPFGGTLSGCVPATTDDLACSLAASRALDTLETKLRKCHELQAKARFSTVVAGVPRAFDEDACATREMQKAAGSIARACAGRPLLGVATAAGATLRDTVAAENGGPYCDASTAVPIDPSGESTGWVPPLADVRSCAARASKNLARLASDLRKCHARAASDGVASREPRVATDACEDAAVARFDLAVARPAATRGCPACLDAAGLASLRDALVARVRAANASTFPCPDPVLHVGEARLDRPTLMALGVQMLISGDADRDASVAMRHRVAGTSVWSDDLPLLRVRPDHVDGRTVPEQFAGSALDLRPATTYEIELHAIDPDGPVDEVVTLLATTRAVPADPAHPRIVPVANAAALAAALADARPGDVITLADGVYAGPFVLSASGTVAEPIVVRGTSRDGTVLDGGGCDCNVLEAYGSFVHVERLTLRNATRALRFQGIGAQGNVLRRVRTQDTRLGVGSQGGQRDFYLCDNELEGRLAWPMTYGDDGGAHADDDGIAVQGDGHVVCHNRIAGFGDAMKTRAPGARAVDFYGNEIVSSYDNGLELDGGEGNLRSLRNRFTNTYVPLSFQPIYGGPAYALRNVAVNVAHEQLKFHGLGGASGPSGVLVYHNTFVSPALALLLETPVASHDFAIVNNLFVTQSDPPGRVVDWLGPIDDGVFASNGYFPDGGFRFNLPPAGLVSQPSFAALQASGFEPGGILLAPPIFQSGLTAPDDYTASLAPADVTLAAGSNALDRGVPLPGVGVPFTGAAPDLGALERGCPLPIYGVRPDGTDESNEPLGCAP
ncbi:hypothetical protein K2Z84_13170 [Candidatus Binatia bacterium]|nr:hypothetical protein [Candidatus Binatia bacterium]